MKKYLNIKNIILAITILIVIAGVVSFCVFGFEKSIEYKAGTRIEIYIPNGYQKQDIINIAKESFNTDEVLFSEIDKLGETAGIKVINYTKEQLEVYVNKITEKYEIVEDEVEYIEKVVPETKLSTVVTPYIKLIILITLISLIYVMIKNYKSNNKIKISLKVLGILVMSLSVYFSFITLLRLQFGIYTMPIALAIYIVTLLILVNKKC